MSAPTDIDPTSPQLVLVTGMSGAGRSTALAVLEDLGYDAMDNLPLSLLPRLSGILPSDGADRPIAVGVDIRNREFGVANMLAGIDQLRATEGLRVFVLFLDCSDEDLVRRFTETRRRHPLATDRPMTDGIRLERQAIQALADTADIMIDTSGLTIWDFKQRMMSLFEPRGDHFSQGPHGAATTLTVLSFSYRRGIPREADIVLDVRFLANPHYDPDLRDLTGLDPAVARAITGDPEFEGFSEDLKALLRRIVPRYQTEGKSYLTIAFGCTGGKHRSVFTAEFMANWLLESGWPTYRFHRDIPRDTDGPA